MKKIIKKILNEFGIDVVVIENIKQKEYKSYIEKQDEKWMPFIRHLNIGTVIDVGANEGQFAEMIHRQIPDAKIISFEPLDSCHQNLSKIISKIPNSRIEPFAVGEVSGTLEMYRNAFSPCSSLLKGNNNLNAVHPDAKNQNLIQVQVVKLDDMIKKEDLDGDLLIKYDVQGFELPAIAGSAQILKKAKIVVIEVCFFRTLYEGQPLFHDIYLKMVDLGFRFMGIADHLMSDQDGRIVEGDAVFERS